MSTSYDEQGDAPDPEAVNLWILILEDNTVERPSLYSTFCCPSRTISWPLCQTGGWTKWAIGLIQRDTSYSLMALELTLGRKNISIKRQQHFEAESVDPSRIQQPSKLQSLVI